MTATVGDYCAGIYILLTDKKKNPGGLCYGYRIPIGDNGLRVTGELEIDQYQALVVKRIFQEYSDGKSPKKIAITLNDENIPAPRSKIGWTQSSINGNRKRRTGILNNELYIGILRWNKLHYRQHPETRMRIPRQNPDEDLITVELSHCRIVSDELWQHVKNRQKKLEQSHSKSMQGDKNKLSGAQACRRPKYLLSGLLRCPKCGGNMVIAGSKPKRYYCMNAQQRGASVCTGIPGIHLEQRHTDFSKTDCKLIVQIEI
jgi:site-specific DNA recombinase